MFSLLSSDISQLLSQEISTRWMRTAAFAFGARFLARPLLLVFLNPTRLTPLLRRASTSLQNEPYANTFLPFQTGKHQFLALFALVRSASAIGRSAASLGGARAETVCALALGDAIGDAAELLLLARRYYGGAAHRAALLIDLVAALVYVRALALKKDARFWSAVQQSFAISSIPPIWLFSFARLQFGSRVSAAFLVSVFLLVIAPRLWKEANRETVMELSETERTESRLNQRLALGLLGFFGLKAMASVGAAFVKQ
jgi:hypothetical protein